MNIFKSFCFKKLCGVPHTKESESGACINNINTFLCIKQQFSFYFISRI